MPAQRLSFCLRATHPPEAPWHALGRGVGPSGSPRERRASLRLASRTLSGAVPACAPAPWAPARGKGSGRLAALIKVGYSLACVASGESRPLCRRSVGVRPAAGTGAAAPRGAAATSAVLGAGEVRGRRLRNFQTAGRSPGRPGNSVPASGPCRPSPRARGGRCCAGRGSGARPGGLRALGAAARGVPEPSMGGGTRRKRFAGGRGRPACSALVVTRKLRGRRTSVPRCAA